VVLYLLTARQNWPCYSTSSPVNINIALYPPKYRNDPKAWSHATAPDRTRPYQADADAAVGEIGRSRSRASSAVAAIYRDPDTIGDWVIGGWVVNRGASGAALALAYLARGDCIRSAVALPANSRQSPTISIRADALTSSGQAAGAPYCTSTDGSS
jgi:hypothetical protein